MNWPDGAKYCVHLYKAGNPPSLIDRRFATTLIVPDAPYPDFRLRKRRVQGWWAYMSVDPQGWWWAKAHDRAFDCEARWPEEAWRVTPTEDIPA